MSRSVAAVATLVVGVALAACSSEPDAGTAEATTTDAATCESATDLRESLAALRAVDVVQGGTAAVQEAWAAVEEDWAQFAEAARDEHGDEVDGVQADARTVQDSVAAAQDAPSAETLGTVAAAVRGFVEGAEGLVEETSETC